MKEKLKDLNDRLTEATKDITFRSWFPLIVYIITFVLIDFLALYTVSYNKYLPFETYPGRIMLPFIVFFASFIFMFGKKTSAVLYAVFSVFLLAYCFAQMCYYNANRSLFRISTVFSAKEGAKFAAGITEDISAKTFLMFFLLLLTAAVGTFLILKFSRSPEKGVPRKFKYVINSLILAGSLAAILLIPYFKSSGAMDNYGSYQAYNYKNFVNGIDIYKDNDIITYFSRDVVCTVKNLINIKSDAGTELVNDYFENRQEHKDNEKTGIFKDKNLIVVMMESLDYNGITEESCPNITRLMREGINFKNFYSARFGDTFTFGTETAINTGLFAPSGVSLTHDYADNSFPYSLAWLLREKGYTANEFHYNTENYYNRGEMSGVYGYENYIRYEDHAANKDQNFEIDDVLITDDALYSRLTENEKFLDFIVTYSAHMPYSTNDTLYLEAVKRHPQLKAEDPNDKKAIFQAKASLTDDMVGKLVERLENDGLMDDTVILFITDHYSASIYDYTIDDALLSNTPCFIYAKNIQPETVDKVCNTGDILPTLLNLFGIENCGKYLGSDIFDDSYEGFAFFHNLSWITGDFYYSNGKIEKSFTGKEADEDLINEMNETVKKRIEVNNRILFSDYYADN
ncbi:MAG: sulfatase-like hydrolase/transferase [Ruminococcus sp.]|nr:sulfatase-like hydrolase/transferase [Ruminococcus sp.]